MRTLNDRGPYPDPCWGSGALDESSAEDESGAKSWTLPPQLYPRVQSARLVRTVEAEILPRLMLLRGTGKTAVDLEPKRAPKLLHEQDALELSRILLHHDLSVAEAYVLAVQDRGVPFQQICLELLAPAARRLGTLWETDESDFMQVSLGLCRLHQLLYQLCSRCGVVDVDVGVPGRRILLAPAPGEQHTFGVIMAGHFFRMAGWSVTSEFPHADMEIAALVKERWYAIVGLSVGSVRQLQNLGNTIELIRRNSMHQAVSVLLGGPIMAGKASLARELGADGVVTDGLAAVSLAEKMFISAVAPR